jgi:hypothetical protein
MWVSRISHIRRLQIRHIPSRSRSLSAKLALAERNRPIERQAQLWPTLSTPCVSRPTLTWSQSEVKKIKAQLLNESRRRLGASKPLIDITPHEWEAIQAGAVSNKRLTDIIDNADIEKVKELALPVAKTQDDVDQALACTCAAQLRPHTG